MEWYMFGPMISRIRVGQKASTRDFPAPSFGARKAYTGQMADKPEK